MKFRIIINLILLVVLFNSIELESQVAEQQISFAMESKPHEYYLKQAELWWNELEKDSTSENAWYNYFRACRNSFGSGDWKTNVINESKYLMEGEEIVKRIKLNIPNTFTYYYLSYLTNGIGTENNENLMKAFEMNPNFPGIHASVVSYAESSNNRDLRKSTNEKWFDTNYISYQLLTYSYNLLNSMEENAILLVQNDNDTYPIWMLQDAKGMRDDVLVINIDFLLLEDYRNAIFEKLNIKKLDLGQIDINEYHNNWEMSVEHIINNYKGLRNIHISMTLFEHLYEKYNPNLYVSGLTLRYSKEKIDLSEFNKNLVEKVFLLDYVDFPFMNERNQFNINYQNINYISCFKDTFDLYMMSSEFEKANDIKKKSISLAERIGNPTLVDRVKSNFK